MPPLKTCTLDQYPLTTTPYGHRPDRVPNAILLALFAATNLWFLTVALSTRVLWLVFTTPLSLACLLETLGYALRVAGWADPWDVRLYGASTVFLTLAPCFASLGIYLTLPETLRALGQTHSPLNPKHLASFTLISDTLYLILQLIGLEVSLWDLNNTTGLGIQSVVGGGYVTAVGTALQSATLVVFLLVVGTVLVRRYRHDRSSNNGTRFNSYQHYNNASDNDPLPPNLYLYTASLLLSATSLLSRTLYRTVVLAKGSFYNTTNDTVPSEAVNVLLFDGLLVIVPVLCLVVFHPAYYVPHTQTDEGEGDADACETSASVQGLWTSGLLSEGAGRGGVRQVIV